jgi:fatty acid desaturase
LIREDSNLNFGHFPVTKEHLKIQYLLSIGVVAFDFFLIILATTVSYFSESWILYLISLVLIGSRMRALNNLVHEASHNLLFVSRRVNYIIGSICAWPILLCFKEYKSSHMLHHRRLGYKDDPDLIREQDLGLGKLPQKLRLHHIICNLPKGYLTYLIGSLYLSQKKLFFVRISAVFIPVGIMCIFGGQPVGNIFLLYWVIPFLTTYQVIKFIAESGEHGDLYDSIPANSDLATKAIKMTRNTIPSLFMGILIYPHGDGFHMLHHRFPSIPGLNLAKFNILLDHSGYYRSISIINNCSLRKHHLLTRLSL